MPASTKVLVGVIFLGLLCVGGGVGGYYGFNIMVDKELVNALTLSGPDDPQYSSFMTAREADDAIAKYRIYVYNLTNAAAFTAGTEKPNITELGPIVYNRYNERFNGQFSSDNSRLTFSQGTVYEYSASESSISENAVITQINPFYISAIDAAGSEGNFRLSLASSMIGRMAPAGDQWATNATFCIATGICGLKAYWQATNSAADPNLNSTQGLVIAAYLSAILQLGTFATLVSTISAGGTAGATALLQANALYSTWGINFNNAVSPNQAGFILGYIVALGNTLYSGMAAQLGHGGNLALKSASIRTMLFSPDILLLTLGSSQSIVVNQTTANQRTNSTLLTGAFDPRLGGLDYYVEVNGVSNVTNYQQPFLVNGRTASIDPFQPDLPETFQIYFPTLRRYATAKRQNYDPVEGIDCRTYVVDTEGLTAVNSFFSIVTKGFAPTKPITGSAFVLSAVHFDHVESIHTNKVLGVPSSKLPTFLQVEPKTGLALRGSLRIQTNVLMNFTIRNYTGIVPTVDTLYYPLFWVEDYRSIHPNAAQTLRRALILAPTISRIIIGVLASIGIVLVVIGAACMIATGQKISEHLV